MTKEQIIENLNTALAEEFEIPKGAITPDADIRQTLDLDSLRALELVAIARKEFDIDITPYDLPKIVIFNDLYSYIKEKNE